jgi:hypothetical protein
MVNPVGNYQITYIFTVLGLSSTSIVSIIEVVSEIAYLLRRRNNAQKRMGDGTRYTDFQRTFFFRTGIPLA